MLTFPKPDVEQFFQTYGIQTFAVSPDEKQVILSTNLNGHYNVWAMDLPNTFPYPLTFHNQSSHALLYDQNGEFILTVVDEDGDENGQIYAIPKEGGELKTIRMAEGAKHLAPLLSDDGKRLYYTSTKEDPTCMKGYVYDLETGQEETLVHGEKAMTVLIDKSPEEKQFLYLKMFANTYSLAYVKSGEEDLLLTPETDQQHTVSEAVFVSEKEVYLLTNYESDFSYLAKFDIETKTFERVFEVEKEELTQLKYNKATHSLYLVSEKGVQSFLYSYDLGTKSSKRIETPVTIIDELVVARSGRLYIRGNSASVPMNLYKQTEKGWESLTNFGVPGVKEEELATPEVVTYPSYDGLPIEALLYRPKQDVDNGHVILWPHGGPQASEQAKFRSLFSFLVYSGYTLFAPNFRGSTGYGLQFMKQVEGDWGHGPRLDNVAGLDWLIDQGYASRDKIFLMGGSYGGYMALLLHGRNGDYFKAVVDIFGPSDLFSFINSVPEHWKPAMAQFVGDPVEDKEKLTEDSPIQYIDSMTKPMLVIQGAKDPRVVQAESDQLVEALKEKGRDVEYIVLEDEGHGFSKKANEILVYQKVLQFFEQHVGVLTR
ncbi:MULTISPECIES: S9 family peptidase [Pontibacillus]|uniref:S9 family peptidase n=1 Tax=Pontibacillus chungwhensis TaxID=265426 RepID=A0ABY8V2Y5_9BACI|nr:MULTISPECIES: S9 family peptidase [Pontibacillus]MCD5324340.1 S9 family peptidase [Pontibacillus sp. HN14]WIF99361.1 S9 family peptidase [Pontibacillus chungwhensis]